MSIASITWFVASTGLPAYSSQGSCTAATEMDQCVFTELPMNTSTTAASLTAGIWNTIHAAISDRLDAWLDSYGKVQSMSNHRLQLKFAAVLASVSIVSSAHAQIQLNDSNPSGVIVSLRPQPTFVFAQDDKKPVAKDDAAKDDKEASDADKKSDDKSDDEKKDADKEDADKTEIDKKDGTGKDDEVKSAAGANTTGSSEAGRLAPITMESVKAPIGAANISVVEIGTKILPDDQAAKQMVPRIPLPGGQDRAFSGLTYRWQAANICHLPLYFEEPMLERHGQQCCPTWMQPAASGGRFLSNVILYPYKATLHPACENRYTLGHFRPGSGAPCLQDTLPWSADAALVQAAATTAVFVGLPW